MAGLLFSGTYAIWGNTAVIGSHTPEAGFLNFS
jgi:hypothetical protein